MKTRTAVTVIGACALVLGLVGYGATSASAATSSAASSRVSQAATVVQFSTPGTFTWTVPAGVTQATFDVSGAQGGDGGSSCCLIGGVTPGAIAGGGGLGGNALVTIAVVAGATYQINVGGRGRPAAKVVPCVAAFCGDFGPVGGGGGGASDVRAGTFGLSDRIIVGGGGGGGAGAYSGDPALVPHLGGAGGAGGGSTGVTGANGIGGAGVNGAGGGAGTQTAGGNGGSSCPALTSFGAQDGTFGLGGDGARSGGTNPGWQGGFNGGGHGGDYSGGCPSGGGGGGGGYYGGGGGGQGGGAPVQPLEGAGGGGGGGSGFGPAGTVFQTGVRVGDGLVIVTFVAPPPLPTSKDECKNGGWQTFGIFKNQGDCVSFVESKGKN